MKAKLRMLPQGNLLVNSPSSRKPVFLQFPYPPCLPGAEYRPEQTEYVKRMNGTGAERPAQTATHEQAGQTVLVKRSAHTSEARPTRRVATSSDSFLGRYEAGECEAVWSDLIALGDKVRGDDYYEDAWAVACETMRRARNNVETLVRRLDGADYHFHSGARAEKYKASLGSLGAVKQAFHGLTGKSADRLRDKTVFQQAAETAEGTLNVIKSSRVVVAAFTAGMDYRGGPCRPHRLAPTVVFHARPRARARHPLDHKRRRPRDKVPSGTFYDDDRPIARFWNRSRADRGRHGF